MSGFFALLAPRSTIESPLIEQIADGLAYRGPDGRGTCRLGGLALAHSLLATREAGPGAGRETVGPHAGGDSTWLVSDARLDDRRHLALALARSDLVEAEDAQLLLHAWHRWGRDCVKYLTGDFSFVVWDGRRRQLFAARDPMGVKPCYWTRQGQWLAVTNTLRSLQRLPGVSKRLCDEAVADFLVWGCRQDPMATSFQDLGRLPPGHCLVAGPGDPPRIEPFWSWPPIAISKEPGEILVTRYRSMLEEAVYDRLTSARATIFLSGGMDSTSVAALARDTLRARRQEIVGLRTQTAIYRRLFDDPEGPVAVRVASALGLSNRVRPADDDLLFDGWEDRFAPAELYDGSMLPLLDDLYQDAASGGRIALTGDGSDPALLHPADQLWRWLAQGRIDRAVAYLVGHTWRRGRLPPLGLRTLLGRSAKDMALPAWLAPDFVARSQLARRVGDQITARRRRFADYPRPEAYRALADPQWASHFESLDPGATGRRVETRFPFFDRRVIELALALPVSWCLEKRVLRQAMSDVLPQEILERPKTPMAGRPVHEFAIPPGVLLDRVRLEKPHFFEYVDSQELIATLGRSSRPRDPAAIRAIALAYWLDETGE